MIADGRSIDQTHHGLGHVAPMNPKGATPRHLGDYTDESLRMDEVYRGRLWSDSTDDVLRVNGKRRRTFKAEAVAS